MKEAQVLDDGGSPHAREAPDRHVTGDVARGEMLDRIGELAATGLRVDQEQRDQREQGRENEVREEQDAHPSSACGCHARAKSTSCAVFAPRTVSRTAGAYTS